MVMPVDEGVEGGKRGLEGRERRKGRERTLRRLGGGLST